MAARSSLRLGNLWCVVHVGHLQVHCAGGLDGGLSSTVALDNLRALPGALDRSTSFVKPVQRILRFTMNAKSYSWLGGSSTQRRSRACRSCAHSKNPRVSKVSDSESVRIEAYVADRATESQLAKQQLPWHDVALSTWVALKLELVHHTPVDGLLRCVLPLHLD